MLKNIRNVMVVSSATMFSRILGLLRDMLTFSCFGTGLLNSAFIIAFTLPNMFRRLLGEGALTSALVPILADKLEKGGRTSAYKFFNGALSYVGLILVGIVGLGILCLWLVLNFFPLKEHWGLSVYLSIFLLPYMLFVCCAALFSAVLNVLGRFGIPALTAVWLNLSMIFCLGALGYWFGQTPEERIYYLCAGVLVGGILQLIIPFLVLLRMGWQFSFNLEVTDDLRELYKLFVPGIFGAAVFQLNLIVSRYIAFGFDDSYVSILYLANRIVELPLGVFAIAIATVIFPGLSSMAANKNWMEYSKSYAQGLRLTLSVTIPACVGLIVLAKPVLQLLFQWGAYDASDVNSTVPVLIIFGLTIPFYSIASIATRGFHALKNTEIPVKIAFRGFILNMVLSLILVFPLKIAGLALANLMSIVYQCIVLHVMLLRKYEISEWVQIRHALLKIIVSSALMGFFTFALKFLVDGFSLDLKMNALVYLIVSIPGSVVFYILTLGILKYEDFSVLKELLNSFLNKKEPAKSAS